MRRMRYVFAVIVGVHHETLRRIVVEAQVAPSFSTGAPKHEKLRFFAKLTAFCALAVGRRQNNSVCPGRVYVSLLNTVKNSRLSPP